MDVDSLGHTCKILHTYDQALEVVSLHVRVYDLIFYSLLFLEEYDCETVGELSFSSLLFWVHAEWDDVLLPCPLYRRSTDGIKPPRRRRPFRPICTCQVQSMLPTLAVFLPPSSTLYPSSKHTNSQNTAERYPQRHSQTWNCTCVRTGGVQRI